MRAERLRLGWWLIACCVGFASGCAGPADPPPIRTGTACVICGMQIQDVRFACERLSQRRWRVFDSIECLLRDSLVADLEVLSDADSRTLHRADSVWVVEGALPSPMGGGYAAFLDRAAADEVATGCSGRVARLEAFRAEGIRP